MNEYRQLHDGEVIDWNCGDREAYRFAGSIQSFLIDGKEAGISPLPNITLMERKGELVTIQGLETIDGKPRMELDDLMYYTRQFLTSEVEIGFPKENKE